MKVSGKIALGALSLNLNRAVQILSGIVLLPLFLKYMPAEEVGVWFLLGQASAFLGLLDFGIGPTLTRRIAMAKGVDGNSNRRVADLVASGWILFRWVAVVCVIFSGILGYSLIAALEFKTISSSTVYITAAIICVGYGLNTWAGNWVCILNGFGRVSSYSVISSVAVTVSIVFKIGFVVSGFGVIALAAIDCITNLATRSILIFYVKKVIPEDVLRSGRWSSVEVRSMVKPALKWWVTVLGGYFTYRTDQFFVAAKVSTEQIAKYQAVYAIVFNITQLAISGVKSSLVFVSQFWGDESYGNVRFLFYKNVWIGAFLVSSGMAFFFTADKWFFALWVGLENYLGWGILVLLFLRYLAYSQFFSMNQLTRATEHEVFVWSSVIGGLFNLVLVYFMADIWGIWGICLAGLIVEVVVNFAYSFYVSSKRLEYSLFKYFNILLSSFLLAVLGVGLPLYLFERFVSFDDVVMLTCCILWSAVVVGSAFFTILKNGKLSNALFGGK